MKLEFLSVVSMRSKMSKLWTRDWWTCTFCNSRDGKQGFRLVLELAWNFKNQFKRMTRVHGYKSSILMKCFPSSIKHKRHKCSSETGSVKVSVKIESDLWKKCFKTFRLHASWNSFKFTSFPQRPWLTMFQIDIHRDFRMHAEFCWKAIQRKKIAWCR